MSDVYNKWLELGFLEGLDKDMGIGLANIYEYTAKFLIAKSDLSESDKIIETIIFPILYRIYTKDKYSISNEEDIQFIIIKLTEHIKSEKITNFINTYSMANNVDVEAEICASFGDEYVDIRLNRLSKKLFLKAKKW